MSDRNLNSLIESLSQEERELTDKILTSISATQVTTNGAKKILSVVEEFINQFVRGEKVPSLL